MTRQPPYCIVICLTAKSRCPFGQKLTSDLCYVIACLWHFIFIYLKLFLYISPISFHIGLFVCLLLFENLLLFLYVLRIRIFVDICKLPINTLCVLIRNSVIFTHNCIKLPILDISNYIESILR